MLTLGPYRRTLARKTLPGVAVGYHGLRDDDPPADSMAFENLHVRASTFDAHCRVIRETCDPITLDDWRQAAAGRRRCRRVRSSSRSTTVPQRGRIGAPILAAHHLPAVVFVCSDPISAGVCSGSTLWRHAKEKRPSSAWKARDYDSWSAACADSAPVDDDDPPRADDAGRSRALSHSRHRDRRAYGAHPILARAPREPPAARRLPATARRSPVDRTARPRVRVSERPPRSRLRRHDDQSPRGARHRHRLHDAALVCAARRACARALAVSDGGRGERRRAGAPAGPYWPR